MFRATVFISDLTSRSLRLPKSFLNGLNIAGFFKESLTRKAADDNGFRREPRPGMRPSRLGHLAVDEVGQRNISALAKGLKMAYRLGVIDRVPRLAAAQAE